MFFLLNQPHRYPAKNVCKSLLGTIIVVPLSYSGMSGFVAKRLRVFEPVGEGCVLPLRTSIADAPSATRFSFFM
jgi:hypothetical protein